MTQYPTEEMIEAGVAACRAAGVFGANDDVFSAIYLAMRAKEQSHSTIEQIISEAIADAARGNLNAASEAALKISPTEATRNDVERALATVRYYRQRLDINDDLGPGEVERLVEAGETLIAAIAALSPNGVSQSAVERAADAIYKAIREHPTIEHDAIAHGLTNNELEDIARAALETTSDDGGSNA